MTGGERLTGALLRDWAMRRVLFPEVQAWAKKHGGALVTVSEHRDMLKIAEEVLKDLKAGKVHPVLQHVNESNVWDEIDDSTRSFVSPDTTWLWFAQTRSPRELVNILGPRGGHRGRVTLGWKFQIDPPLPTNCWQVPMSQPAGSLTHAYADGYRWLFGSPHVACLVSDFSTLSVALQTNLVFCDIIASMFNQMLDNITPMATNLFLAPDGKHRGYETQLTALQITMAKRAKGRKEELTEQVENLEQDAKRLKRHTALLSGKAADLTTSLQTMLAKGLVSQIKQDSRGLWFLFDEIYGVVDDEMAIFSGATAGIYKIPPAVIFLAWGNHGGDWTCGTPDGDNHRHPHAGNSGAFGQPCLGRAGMGPGKISNKEWFAHLWDEDPVKWAEAIHDFMRRTEWTGGRYRGIWEFGTLVTPNPISLPTLTVTKLPEPTLLVTRTKEPRERTA